MQAIFSMHVHTERESHDATIASLCARVTLLRYTDYALIPI